MLLMIGSVLWGFLSHFSDLILKGFEENDESENMSLLRRYAAGWGLATPVVMVLAHAVEPDEGKKKRAAVTAGVVHLAAGVIYGSGVALGRFVHYLIYDGK